MSRHLSTRNISSKSMHAILSNLANRQTDRQTRAKTYTSSFVGGNKRLCWTFCTIEANYWQARSIARPIYYLYECYKNIVREHDFVVSVSVAGVDMCLFFAGARTSTATTPGMLATTTKSTSRATTTSATTKSPSSETFPVVFYFQLQSLLSSVISNELRCSIQLL